MVERMIEGLSLYLRKTATLVFGPRLVGLNTMDMVDANEAVEARDMIEQGFGIQFSDAEMAATTTVYDLFKLVWAKLPTDSKLGQFPELAVWHRLCDLLRHITMYSGPIDLETTFFAEHAKARKHHG